MRRCLKADGDGADASSGQVTSRSISRCRMLKRPLTNRAPGNGSRLTDVCALWRLLGGNPKLGNCFPLPRVIIHLQFTHMYYLYLLFVLVSFSIGLYCQCISVPFSPVPSIHFSSFIILFPDCFPPFGTNKVELS